MTLAERITRTSQSRPCPVCGSGTKGCSIKGDGIHWCRGEPLEGWKCVKRGDEFHSYRRSDDTARLNGHHTNGHTTHAAPPPRDWLAEAKGYAANLTEEARAALAKDLGLPVEALDVEPLLGWIPDAHPAPCWTFPEFDGTGRIVGINRRFVQAVSINDGKPTTKAAITGSARGLTYPANLLDRPGPVLIVEGASDVLALAHCDLAVVGRPAALVGSEILATLLKEVPADRPIVVLAENDKKPDGRWPGREGAEHVAARLSAALCRPVRVAFPPDDTKDGRAWVRDLAAGQAESEDWQAVGVAILEHVEGQRPKPRFPFVDSATFFATEYRVEWLIPEVFVKNQPMVIAGPSKGMKTTIAVDAAISLAAGRPFLGKFDVPRRVRAAIVSGESGEATLKETALRIARARGVEPASLKDHLAWCFSLPTLSNAGDMREFTDQLIALNAEVVFIDPLYLCLGDVDAKSMFEMGAALRAVAETMGKAGVTTAICHHANRLLATGEPMELQHLAYSGLEQFTRQFILLNRREKYQSDGVHDLWMRVGGSAGHGGLWGLHIQEGVTRRDGTGRGWDVDVQTMSELNAGMVNDRERTKEEKNRQRQRAEEAKLLEAIDAEMSTGVPAATRTKVRGRTAWRPEKVKEIADGLIEEGLIEIHEFSKPTGNGAMLRSEGFRRVPRGNASNASNARVTSVFSPPSEQEGNDGGE